MVWKLKKSLYGLKQASCAWYQKVKVKFEKIGFTQCYSDYSIFISMNSHKFCIITPYVNDLMVLSNNAKVLKEKKRELMRVFRMKDLGPIHWFLSLEIIWDQVQCLISMSQRCYITEVVSHFGFSNAHLTSTPISINIKLPILHAPEINACKYQAHIGSIMYDMLGTQPDIVYTIGMLSQYSANPGSDHVNAVNCLL